MESCHRGGILAFSGYGESIVKNVGRLVQVLQECLHEGNGRRWGHRRRQWEKGLW